jgi:hypothetical protein
LKTVEAPGASVALVGPLYWPASRSSVGFVVRVEQPLTTVICVQRQ